MTWPALDGAGRSSPRHSAWALFDSRVRVTPLSDARTGTMTNRTKISLLKKLRDAIVKVLDENQPDLQIMTSHDMAGGNPSLAWEGGPFEWTMIAAGSSLFAGEMSEYSLPVQPQIAEVIDKIKQEGGYLEVATSWMVYIQEL
jgi:hypothetical protein